MGIRKKLVNGHEYYYLEESIRLEKPKVYSLFLGRKIPDNAGIEQARQRLLDKIYADLLNDADRIYLAKEQLIEAEKRRRRYAKKMKLLSKAGRDEKDEVDTVNFVYTTLTTEGVPITKEDADLAYRFNQKNIKNIRDENLKVALDMIKGLRYVKESKKGITLAFLLELHKIIMAEYNDKKPGSFRKKQAYIYLKSYGKVEEIGFRPPTPESITPKLNELVDWYNANVGKLNALELAALLHLRFYMIHPFEDGNKRIARLLVNKALFDSGYPMLNISKETQNYFNALIKSVEKKDEKPFAQFVFEQFIRFI
ncbi:MAG: Fic family protein [Candidatus Micrarchaeota archaeon]